MKILILSNIFPPGFLGGYELVALDAAEGLRAKGHEIQVLTSDYFLDDENQLAALNVSRTLEWQVLSHERTFVFNDIRRSYYNFHNIRRLGETIRQFEPAVVLAFNLDGLGVFSIVQFLQKIRMPLVLFLGDNIFSGLHADSEIYKQYERVLGGLDLKSLTKVIPTSENVAREIESTLGKKLGNAEVIPGWVKFDKGTHLAPCAEKSGIRKFVFLSRIAPHKGIQIVVEAAERLVQAKQVSFEIDVYGSGDVASLLHTIMIKKLDGHIKYKGLIPRQDVVAMLSNYDALLFPTWEREPFGLVAVEAAVAGCFSIMTAGIGASEWFLDGHDCLKISRDAGSLHAAMAQVIAWSQDEVLKMRNAAMRCGRKNFSFEYWLSVLERDCLEMGREGRGASPRQWAKATRGAEGAFLFLGSLLGNPA